MPASDFAPVDRGPCLPQKDCEPERPARIQNDKTDERGSDKKDHRHVCLSLHCLDGRYRLPAPSYMDNVGGSSGSCCGLAELEYVWLCKKWAWGLSVSLTQQLENSAALRGEQHLCLPRLLLCNLSFKGSQFPLTLLLVRRIQSSPVWPPPDPIRGLRYSITWVARRKRRWATSCRDKEDQPSELCGWRDFAGSPVRARRILDAKGKPVGKAKTTLTQKKKKKRQIILSIASVGPTLFL